MFIKIFTILFAISFFSIILPEKSFSQDEFVWSDSVVCKDVEGNILSFYFSNGQSSHSGTNNYAYRFYNYYEENLFIMWTAFHVDDSNESNGFIIESRKYMQFKVPSPVKNIVVTKFDKLE